LRWARHPTTTPPRHGHGHAHGHAPSADADRRWLAVALALIAGFMAVEVVAGLLAGSLALLSDAAHMLTDAAAIGLALVAARLAARPARGPFTFGLGRAEILSAQVNGASLLVLAAVIGWEAVRRLADPPEVEGGIVIAVGLAGALVNVAAAWALSRAERQSLNVAGARAHVLADLYGSVAAVAAASSSPLTGFREADGIAALLVAALMLRSGWALVRDASRVLLESAPRGTSPPRSAARWPPTRDHRGPRPPRVGGHLGLLRALGPRPRPARRGLPRPPLRARGAPARPLRDRAHDAAGRARGPAPARHRPLGRAPDASAGRPSARR
jgi:cobalt-zinc-cadmium efflux system protein